MQRAFLLYFLGSESFVLYYQISLIYFKSVFHFLYPQKTFENQGFSMLSGGTEVVH